jgi:hypothetical protein
MAGERRGGGLTFGPIRDGEELIFSLRPGSLSMRVGANPEKGMLALPPSMPHSSYRVMVSLGYQAEIEIGWYETTE